MKKTHLISLTTTFLVAVTVIVSMVGRSAFAATGSIYLTPASPSVLNGDNVTLSLRINPGTTVDGVQATVNFDTSKLQYVTADTSSSAFSVQLQQSQTGGTVTIARGDLSGGIGADSLIETITFKALVGSGSSGVTLTNANATYQGAYTNPSPANATVTLTSPITPPPTCPTGQIGTPPNCTTPTTGGTSGGTSGGGTTPKPKPSPTPTPTPPASTGTGTTPVVEQKDLQFTKAVFNMTTTAPTQIYVQFGLDKNTLDKQTALSELGTTHAVTLDDGNLLPGETYYFVVVSKDQQGHIAQTALQNFTTKGLTVTVGVYDKNHKPLRNKTVTLHSTPMTGKTDDRGFVTFSNVVPGDHHVLYADGKKSYDKPIAVENNVKTAGATQTAPVQNVSVVYDINASNAATAQRVLIGTLLLVVVGVAVFFVARRKSHFIAPGGAPLSMQPVVVGGNPSVSTPVMQQPTAQPQASAPSAEGIAQQLSTIPDPSNPTPGSTVAPVDEDRKE